MSRVLHLVRHDSRLFLMRKENFFFMLGMPVLFMLFFSSVFRGGSGPETVKVSLSVVDEDHSFLSSGLVQQLQGEHFEVNTVTRARADSTELLRVLTTSCAVGVCQEV